MIEFNPKYVYIDTNKNEFHLSSDILKEDGFFHLCGVNGRSFLEIINFVYRAINYNRNLRKLPDEIKHSIKLAYCSYYPECIFD